jgi:hypothetical protein
MNAQGKIIKALLIVIVVSVFIDKQEMYSQIMIGPKAGINLGNLSIDNQVSSASNGYRIGLIAGCAIEARLNNRLSIQVEPTYIQKGSLISFNNGSYQVETKNRFGYIQVPVMMKVRFESKPIIPYLLIGPSVGFLLSATAVSNYVYPTPLEYDEKPNYQSSDITIDIGAGCEIITSSVLVLVADARYSFGIYNIHKAQGGEVKTRGIQILIGTLLPL